MWRKTCRLACGWVSPPGVPNGTTRLPLRIASAGFGVRRGRLPPSTEDAWPGIAQDWEPRAEGQNPVPGMTGDSQVTSDGFEEKTLPSLSITATYDVSPGQAGSPTAACGRTGAAPARPVSPAGG